MKLLVHSGSLNCFSFYENLDVLRMDDLQYKKDFKWKIVHPYYQTTPIMPADILPKYEVILKICTLHKGVPYGPSLISFKHPEDVYESFDGVGIFRNG